MSTLSDLVPRMRKMNKPVIAAINGAAIGGGMCLTLGADIRIAGESAYFRAAGINNGLTANELGLSFLLPRAISATRAFELMLSGRDISATEAAEIGLVSATVPDDRLIEEALDLADQINGWSTQGVALTKRLMWAGLGNQQPPSRDRDGKPHSAVCAPHHQELRGSNRSPRRGPAPPTS